MANEQNLLPFTSHQSREKARENGRKGGIASGIAKRKRKSMAKTLDYLMSTPVQDVEMKDTLSNIGIEEEEQNYQMCLIVAEFKRALKGDKESLKFITDMLQETPKENSNPEVGGTIIVDDLEYVEDEDDEQEPNENED